MMDMWQLKRGANVVAGGGVHFSVWAPLATRVRVRLTSGQTQDLARNENGVFDGTVADARVGSDYAFLIDENDKGIPDPVSRWQPDGVHGPSRVVDPRTFQ